MILIDQDSALEGLRHAVATKGPHHVAGELLYVTSDIKTGKLKPCCMIGTALAFIGIPLEVLSQPCVNTARIDSIVPDLLRADVTLTPAAVACFEAAQQVQDGLDSDGINYGGPDMWGAALKAAERAAKAEE
jgi:hypothetical protein